MADNSLGAKVGSPVVLPNIGTYEVTTSYTFGALTTPPTAGTGATYYRNTFRDMDYAEVRWEFNQAAAGTAGSSSYTLPLPTGLTVDTSRVAVASAGGYLGYVGKGWLRAASAFYDALVYYDKSSGKILVSLSNETQVLTDWSSALAALSNTVVQFSFTARIPITEWVTSATLAYGAGLATSAKAGLVSNYSEGTFTPTFSSTGTAPSTTYTTQTGEYTKIGDTVHFTLRLTSLSFTVAGTGNVRIAGLPFTAKNTVHKSATVGFSASFSTGQNPLSALITPNATTLELYYRTGSATPSIDVPVAAYASGCDIFISGSYKV